MLNWNFLLLFTFGTVSWFPTLVYITFIRIYLSVQTKLEFFAWKALAICCLSNSFIFTHIRICPNTQLFSVHRTYQSCLHLVTAGFDSVCIVVARWVNFRQKGNMNTNFSYSTTMYENGIRINTAVASCEAGKVTYNDFCFSKC